MHFDMASIFVTTLVLALAFAGGLVVQVQLEASYGEKSSLLSMVRAIAGIRGSLHSKLAVNEHAVALRIVLYIGICALAIVLAAAGKATYAYVCAVPGGLAMGLVLIRFFVR